MGRDRAARLPSLGLVLATGLACSSGSEPSRAQGTGAQLAPVATGLNVPLYLTSPPADPRLFIVEKTGSIRIVRDGTLLPTPFLDIGDRISNGGEQGLLGLAFDPQYASTGRFVVHYTDVEGNTRLSLFQVSSDPDRADPASEQLILSTPQPYSNHNGGQVTFGPDGFLYLGLGDGGASGDPQGRGQDRSDLLGSILRIDVAGGAAYIVPADNPFIGQPGIQPEIWSFGLRNPWRFSFDRVTGDLYLADVGEGSREEIDVIPPSAGAGRGANFGWNVMEGSRCFSRNPCDRSGLILPVLEYSHDEGCSVTGGYVYRGSAIPALQGVYFYGDFCGGWVRSFRYAGGEATEQTDWPALAPGGSVISFGEDSAGELYVMDTGGVFKVVPENTAP